MKNEKQKDLFGLDADERKKAKEAKDILPTFDLSKLGVNDTFKCTIRSKMPYNVKHKDKDGKEIETPVLTVYDPLTEGLYTIWLSAKSLKMRMFALYEENKNSLEGLDVVIGIQLYEHKKFGSDTKAYTVTKQVKR